MQGKQKKIKGFTLLEILVVVAIVSIISAVAYPNFSTWKRDREVAQASEKIANIFRTLTSKSQGGAYPYIQLYVCEGGTCNDMNTEGAVRFYGRGLFKNEFASIRNQGNVPDCSEEAIDWANPAGNDRIGFHGDDNISIQFANDEGAVCFSQDGSFYSTELGIADNNPIELPPNARQTENYILICDRNNAINGSCPLNLAEGLEKPSYVIEWSRFGKITKYRFTERGGGGWTQQ